MIRKTYAIELRGFDEAAQTATYLLTNQSLDRDDEIVMADGMDDSSYKNNPVWLWGHAHGGPPDYCLGHAVKWVREGDGWLFTVWYDIQNNPTAKLVYGLVGSKSLRAVSVGFIPLQAVTASSPTEEIEAISDERVRQLLVAGKCRCVYTRWEMLEGSNVHIGSNRETIARGCHSIQPDPLSTDLRKFLREELSMHVIEVKAVETSSEEALKAAVRTIVKASSEDVSKAERAGAQKKEYWCCPVHPIVADIVSRLSAQANTLAQTLDPDGDGDIEAVDAIPAICDVLTAVIVQLRSLLAADADEDAPKPVAVKPIANDATDDYEEDGMKTLKSGRAISAENVSSMTTAMGHMEEGVRKCVKAMHHIDGLVTGAGGDSCMPKDFPNSPSDMVDSDVRAGDPDVYDPVLASVADYVDQLNKILE